MQTLPNVMPDITQRNIYGELYGDCIRREIKIDNAPKPLRDIGDMKPYLLNTNRLSALYSKIGPPTEKTNTDVITRDLIKDAVKDYDTEQGVDIANVMNTAFTYFQEVLYFVNEDLKTRLG